MKLKLVLRDVDGQADLAQGRVHADNFEDKHLVKWQGRLFAFEHNHYEKGEIVAFFRECRELYEITEF